jgi:hypothetical protein
MTWTNHYVGREWTDTYDCAELVMDVLRTHYGKVVAVPSSRTYYKPGDNLNNVIDGYVQSLLEKVTPPKDGDVVLMQNGNALNHVGVYTLISGIPFILHNIENVGVVCQKPREITKYSLKIEGYYRLKEETEKVMEENGTDCSNNKSAVSC